MDIQNVTLRGYMAHSIRGRKGDKSPQSEIETNCVKAAQDGAQLMAIFQRCGWPVYLYVPGAHDDFVQKAYKAGRLTEEEILTTDCELMQNCDFLLIYDWCDYIGGGVKVEKEYAEAHNIPVIHIKKLDQETVWYLQAEMISMLLEKIRTPTIVQIHGGNDAQ